MAKAVRLGILLAIALALGGCVVGPDFEKPQAPGIASYLPSDRGNGRERIRGVKLAFDAHLPGDWWEVLGSRNLNELIELGLAQNSDLEAAEAAIRVAEANSLAIKGGFWPTLTAGWNSSRQLTADRTVTSNHATGKSSYSLHTAQVSVAYVADVFGSIRRQVEASEAMVEMQEFQREAVVLTLTSNIALAAIQLASFEGQIAATKRLIKLQSQLLDILKRQQAAGQIALPDVLAQETAVAQAKLLLPPLERQYDQQRNLIAVLTGRFPAEVGHKERFQLASFKFPKSLPVSVPGDLVRQRPDIRVAEANLKQSNAQIGVAIAARLPTITLTGNGGSIADAVGKLFLPSTWFYIIAGNAVTTLFDGRTLMMKQVAAEETFNQQTAQYKSVVLTAFQNVADVLRAIEADAHLVIAAREAEAAAERSLALIRQQLDQGQVSLPALLNAQQALLQTSLVRVQAQASRLSNAVALYQALGGGWWERRHHEPEDSHHDRYPHVKNDLPGEFRNQVEKVFHRD